MLATASKSEIEKRAFEIYEKGGRKAGRDLDDWLLAEKEILSNKSQKDRSRFSSRNEKITA